jgi:hypothetical protein
MESVSPMPAMPAPTSRDWPMISRRHGRRRGRPCERASDWRALITEIVADVDEEAGEIVLVIHWKGGQHSELRVRKPRTGEHGCCKQVLAVKTPREVHLPGL